MFEFWLESRDRLAKAAHVASSPHRSAGGLSSKSEYIPVIVLNAVCSANRDAADYVGLTFARIEPGRFTIPAPEGRRTADVVTVVITKPPICRG